MKIEKILNKIINLLFCGLLTALVAKILFLISVCFFSDYLPYIFKRGFGKILNLNFFSWRFFLLDIIPLINFILFTLAIFFLRKSIYSFINLDFYVISTTENFKKTGSIFIFIGVTTILLKLFSVVYISNITQNIIDINFFILAFDSIITAIDLKSIFLIIIGLFFLLFRISFIKARNLKQENDLTI